MIWGLAKKNKTNYTLPGVYNTYVLGNLPCYGFVFDENGNVWYKDYCPDDYSDGSKFGTYSIHEDTVTINSTFLTTGERIHRISIKSIEHKTIDQDTFEIRALNSEGIQEGLVFSIHYKKYPKWPWRKEKFIRLLKPIDWSEIPEKIYVDQIWVSGLKNQPANNGIWFNVNEKWEIKNRRTDITFFGESLKIIRKGEEIVLLKWDRTKNDYIEFDKLYHKI